MYYIMSKMLLENVNNLSDNYSYLENNLISFTMVVAIMCIELVY